MSASLWVRYNPDIGQMAAHIEVFIDNQIQGFMEMTPFGELTPPSRLRRSADQALVPGNKHGCDFVVWVMSRGNPCYELRVPEGTIERILEDGKNIRENNASESEWFQKLECECRELLE